MTQLIWLGIGFTANVQSMDSYGSFEYLKTLDIQSLGKVLYDIDYRLYNILLSFTNHEMTYCD